MSHGGARLAIDRWIAPRTPLTRLARVCGDGTTCNDGSGDEDEGDGGSGGGCDDRGGGGGGDMTARGERSLKLFLVNVSWSRARGVFRVCEFGGLFFS